MQVAASVIDGKVLEFYKWDGDLQTLLANVKAKLNKVAEVCLAQSFVDSSVFYPACE